MQVKRMPVTRRHCNGYFFALKSPRLLSCRDALAWHGHAGPGDPGTARIAVAQKWLARHSTEMYGTASAGTARHGRPWQGSPWHGTARKCTARPGLWHSMSPAQLPSQIPTWALGHKLQVAFQTAYGYLTETLRLQRALR